MIPINKLINKLNPPKLNTPSKNTNNAQNTPVDINYQYNARKTPAFNMIDNYIYLYHTDTLIALPTFPESIADNMAVEFSPTTILSRSAPIYSYSSSGPRSFQVSLSLHRDLMNEINTSGSKLNIDTFGDDYVDILVKQLQAAALPKYSDGEKMVDPPIIAVRFGDQIFCKGVVTGGVTVTYSGPIVRSDSSVAPKDDKSGGKYAQIQVEFQINEIDPYDAQSVMSLGSFRGINTTLERRVWKQKK